MSPALFVVMTDANFAGVSDSQIQGSVSLNGNTYFITGTLTPPAGTLYVARLNANGTFIVSQSRQPALTPALTFFGWAIPA